MASKTITYILWFFLGVFGVHHFYLKRDRHALVWFCTFGGFLFGWLRDFIKIPDYVRHSNEDETWVNEYIRESQVDNKFSMPCSRSSCSVARFFGMLVMAYVFSALTLVCCPTIYCNKPNILVSTYLYLTPSFAAAIAVWLQECLVNCIIYWYLRLEGVHLVANIGRFQTLFRWCLVGSAVGMIWSGGDYRNFGYPCLFSTGVTYFFGMSHTTHPTTVKHRSTCRRAATVLLCGTVYVSLWCASLYYNTTITSEDGEKVPVRVALNNFIKSPAWTETKVMLFSIWLQVKHNRWYTFQKFLSAINSDRESSAFKVLDLPSSASKEDVRRRYKALVREWHPDKHIDPARKEMAEQRFMEVQNAYKTLSGAQHAKFHQEPSTEKHEEF